MAGHSRALGLPQGWSPGCGRPCPVGWPWDPLPVPCPQTVAAAPGPCQGSPPALPLCLSGFLVLRPWAGITVTPPCLAGVCSLCTFSEVTWGPSPGHPLRRGRTGGTSGEHERSFWVKESPHSLCGGAWGVAQPGPPGPLGNAPGPWTCWWEEGHTGDREGKQDPAPKQVPGPVRSRSRPEIRTQGRL